jgi:hypothetical protein
MALSFLTYLTAEGRQMKAYQKKIPSQQHQQLMLDAICFLSTFQSRFAKTNIETLHYLKLSDEQKEALSSFQHSPIAITSEELIGNPQPYADFTIRDPFNAMLDHMHTDFQEFTTPSYKGIISWRSDISAPRYLALSGSQAGKATQQPVVFTFPQELVTNQEHAEDLKTPLNRGEFFGVTITGNGNRVRLERRLDVGTYERSVSIQYFHLGECADRQIYVTNLEQLRDTEQEFRFRKRTT